MAATLHPQAVVIDDEEESWIVEFRRNIQKNSKDRHEEMSRQTTEEFKKAIGNPSLDSDTRALLQQEFKRTMIQINQRLKDEEDMLVEQEKTLRRWLKDSEDKVVQEGPTMNTDLTKSTYSNSSDENATQGESLSSEFEDQLRTAMSILMAPPTIGLKNREALLNAREKQLKHEEELRRRREFLLIQREIEVLRREEELDAIRESLKQRESKWQEELLRLREEVIRHREEAVRREEQRRRGEESRRREQGLHERRRKEEELHREEEHRLHENEPRHGEERRRRGGTSQERRRLEDEARRTEEEARRREEEIRRREEERRRLEEERRLQEEELRRREEQFRRREEERRLQEEELRRREEQLRRREEERRREERTRHELDETRLTENHDNTRGRSTRVKSISPPSRPSRLSSHNIAQSTSTGQYPTRNASSGSASRFSSPTRSTLWSASDSSSSRPSVTESSTNNHSGRSWSTDRSTFDQQGTGHRIWRPNSAYSPPRRASPTDNTAARGAKGLPRSSSSSSSSQSAVADSERKRYSSLFGSKYKSTPVGSQTPAPRSSSKSHSQTAGRSNERNIHEWEKRQQEAAQKQQAQFRAEAAQREKAAIAKDALSMNKDDVVAAWSNYQKWWSTARDRDILQFRTIFWPTVTTISAAEDLTVNRIASFVLSPHHSQDKSSKDRIKEQLLRWHPDRFEGRYLPKVPVEERDAVRQAVGQVVKALNDLMSRDRDNPFA